MISAVIFDLDGTLTRTASPWRYVHERIGVWHGHAEHYLTEWLSGRITYEEFCRRDLALWNGRSIDEIHSILDEIEFNRHVPEVIGRVVARGVPSVIISSGFHYIARKIQSQCAWNPLLIHANELDDGPAVRINVSGDFDSPIGKKAHADRALAHFGAVPENTLVVSDTHRDMELLAHIEHKLLIEDEDDLLRVGEYL